MPFSSKAPHLPCSNCGDGIQQLLGLSGGKAVISALGRLKQGHCELGQPWLHSKKAKQSNNSLIVDDKEVVALSMDKLPPRKGSRGPTTKKKGLGRT